MSALAVLVQQRLRQFDSLRDASRKLGIGHVYLYRLASGKQANPSDDVLRKLGITRTIRINYRMEPSQ